MIFAHALIGLIPIDNLEFSWFLFFGSIFPDIDHLIVIYKHKIFSWDKIIDTIKFEDKYNLHYKTKYLHSFFGAIITSTPIIFMSTKGFLYFFIAYIIHLGIDWFDQDEKQYFYPFKKKVRGFLPIFSKAEIVFTICLLGLYIYFIF